MPSIVTRVKGGLTRVFTGKAPTAPTTINPPSSTTLGFIEQQMLNQFLNASSDVQEELQDLAATKSTAELTTILQDRYPSYANYITEERVGNVMSAYQQRLRPSTPVVPVSPRSPAPHIPMPSISSQPDPITVPAITIEQMITPKGQAFSDLTAEELSARRRAILASTPFNLPFHRVFMNGIKEAWRVLGPLAFVVFTVWEVYYFMSHFLQTANVFDVVLLWGISLIIEIPFMIATYDQSERRERVAERRARGEDANVPGALSSLLFWCLLALVNVAGQIAFLSFVTKAGYSLSSPAALGLWSFIILRVTGVLIGDCYTAFHLLPTEANIDWVLRGQKAQIDGEKRLSDSDAERLRKEAESQQTVRRIQLSVKRDEREANFMENWQKMNMEQTLERQRHFIELERQQLRQLPSGEDRQQETGDF